MFTDNNPSSLQQIFVIKNLICPDNVRALSVCPSSSTTIHILFTLIVKTKVSLKSDILQRSASICCQDSSWLYLFSIISFLQCDSGFKILIFIDSSTRPEFII